MMTVFHIIYRFDIGGAERVALNISKSNSKNIEYHLIEIAAAGIIPSNLSKKRRITVSQCIELKLEIQNWPCLLFRQGLLL